MPVRTFFGLPRALIGLVDAVTVTDVNGVALLLLEVEVEVEILELDDGFLNPNFQAFTFSSPPWLFDEADTEEEDEEEEEEEEDASG